MAKDHERKEASKMYINDRKTAKEISKILKVTEKTIGGWVKEGNWKERRNAKLGSVESADETARKLSNIYAEKLLALSQEDDCGDIDERERISKEENRLADLIAKTNKYRESFEKEHRIPYNVYINVAEQIMNAALEEITKDVQPEVLDFFENHINNLALKYK